MSAPTVAAEVSEAIDALKAHFGDRLAEAPDGEGGSIVTVESVALGEGWTRAKAPLTFVVPYNFPAVPPYPYYLPRDAHPQGAWPQALQPVQWRGDAAVQVSLRNNHWDPARDALLGCVLQVADWLREQ